MFSKQPKKKEYMDQIEVQIEKHRRVGNNLKKEIETWKAQVKEYHQMGDKFLRNEAYQGFQEVRKSWRSNETTYLRLQRVRSRLRNTTEGLTQKTMQGIENLLKDSQKVFLQINESLPRILDRGGIIDDTTTSSIVHDFDEEPEGLRDLLGEDAGELELTGDDPVIEIPEDMPDVPMIDVEEEKEKRKKIKEDTP